jgi:hypothetical protein
VRVRLGSFEIVRLRRAAEAAFLMFRRAAVFCFAVMPEAAASHAAMHATARRFHNRRVI